MIKTKTHRNRIGAPAAAFLRKISIAMGLALWGATVAAQAGQGPQPSICSRSCWGARAPQCGITQMSSLTRAIIHHTGSASEYSTNYETSKAKCRGNQSYVMDSLGYCDADYHFWVDGAGKIFEGRSGSLSSLPRGSHDGCNANSFGFAVFGNFETQSFPAAARSGLEAIIAWRMPSSWSATGSSSYCSSGTIGTMDGHHQVKATACPGANIIPQISGMRTGVMNRKNGTVAPAEVVSPSFITRTDGKMAAFGITTAGAVQYRMKDSIGAAWGSWVNLGGTTYSHMRAIANDAGGMAVFGISGSTSTVSYRYLASAGSGIWSDWIALGGTSFYRVAPIMKTDGKMGILGNGQDGTVFYKEQTAVGAGAAWTGWTELPATDVWEIDALPLPNGGAAAFMVGGSGPVYYNSKASSTAAWTGWTNLGGSGFSRISAVMGTTGKMAFFGSADGTGSPIFYQEQTAVGAGAGWTGWVSLGGGGYSSISGVALPNGGLAVFGCTDNGTGSSVFYQKRPSDTSAWNGYFELPATNVRRVAATVNGGLMSVSMRGGTGAALWERPQTGSSSWAAWQNLGGTLK